MHVKKYYLCMALFFSFALISHNAAAGGSKVRIEKSQGKNILLLNEKPIFIKGVGFSLYGNREEEEKFFKLAKEMGANSVRQWGVAPDEEGVLELAQKYGLMIDLGIWVTWNKSYTESSDIQKEQILGWVKQYKDHPALLLWNLGNENISNLKTEEEKINFSKYLERIAKAVHLADPNHPIVYTDAAAAGIPFLKFMPSVDIYGFNAYKAIEVAEGLARRNHLDRPYIYSEFGPDGWWEAKKDENNQPEEPIGSDKAKIYTERWRRYIENKNDCFGGYAFLLNEKMEESKTWWGITYQGLRTISYWALRNAYSGAKCSYSLPKVSKFHISKTKDIKMGKDIQISITGQGTNITYNFDVPLIAGASLSSKSENTFTYKTPSCTGIFRIYAFIQDDKGNVDTASKTISVVE